jgi:hypothetical protein
MRGIWPPDGGDMLTICLDNVLASARTANDKAVIVGLNENITRPSSLDIADNFRDWTPLSKSKASVLTSRNA